MSRCDLTRCPADFPHKIDILDPKRTTTPDGGGGFTTQAAGVDIAGIHAGFKLKLRDEEFEVGKITGSVIMAGEFRYSTALAALDLMKKQIRWETRIFDIIAIADVEGRHILYQYKAVEIDADG